MIQKTLFVYPLPISALVFSILIFISEITFSQPNAWKKTGGPPGGTAWCFATNSTGWLFAGNDYYGVFKSNDFGEHWISTGPGLPNSMIYSLVVNKNGVIYAGTDGSGVYRSTNNGDTWISSSIGLSIASVYCLAIDSAGAIYAGSVNGVGFFSRSDDDGLSWKRADNSAGWSVGSIVVNSKGHIFISTFSEILRSTDKGTTWIKADHSLRDIRGITVDRNDNLFVGGWENNHIYKSTDNGDDWNLLSNDSTGTEVWSIAFDSHNHIFAAIQGRGVYRSLDGGLTWSLSNSGLVSKELVALTVNG